MGFGSHQTGTWTYNATLCLGGHFGVCARTYSTPVLEDAAKSVLRPISNPHCPIKIIKQAFGFLGPFPAKSWDGGTGYCSEDEASLDVDPCQGSPSSRNGKLVLSLPEPSHKKAKGLREEWPCSLRTCIWNHNTPSPPAALENTLLTPSKALP